jgi:hypothetical protein
MLEDENNYREKFLNFAISEGFLSSVSADDVARSSTRDDLGLSSLNVILLIVNYLKQNSRDVTLDPEWVASLDDVDGIISVMREIDELCAQRVPAS